MKWVNLFMIFWRYYLILVDKQDLFDRLNSHHKNGDIGDDIKEPIIDSKNYLILEWKLGTLVIKLAPERIISLCIQHSNKKTFFKDSLIKTLLRKLDLENMTAVAASADSCSSSSSRFNQGTWSSLHPHRKRNSLARTIILNITRKTGRIWQIE